MRMREIWCGNERVSVRSPDALEKEAEAGGKLDTYEVEGPDRAELLQDLAEFQLAAVRSSLHGAFSCESWRVLCRVLLALQAQLLLQ